MQNILTSWKEIGQYLGKGVRTVQRWEREAGLPVRRRENPARHAVLAMTEELDEWARSSTRGPGGLVAESLRQEIAVLRDETSELRRRVDHIEDEWDGNTATLMRFGPEMIGDADKSLKWIRIRVLHARQARARTIRASLCFASTLCAMGESGFRGTDLHLARRARQSIRRIRDCLDRPGYVPGDELNELRGRLKGLESRVEFIEEESPENQDERTA
jgi:tetrahydromethanopterin S-methyltransferase subunit G